MTLGKLLNLSVPQFLYWLNEDNHRTHNGSVGGPGENILEECLMQCLAQGWWSKNVCWPALVAHVYHPSYSGAETRRIKIESQPLAISSQDPILKKVHHKKGLVEWLKVKSTCQA
jgi:hypothetical protein